jgi:hypothetical protein
MASNPAFMTPLNSRDYEFPGGTDHRNIYTIISHLRCIASQ